MLQVLDTCLVTLSLIITEALKWLSVVAHPKAKITLGKQTWCLTSTETVRLIRDGEKGVWR